MKLEDAFLCVVFDDGLSGGALEDACREAIAGGADMVQVAGAGAGSAGVEAARRLAELCAEEEALLVLRDNVELAAELGRVGVHIGDAGAEIGIARAKLGGKGFVGMSSRTLDDARLSLEVGVDYLIHQGGVESGGVFAALREEAGVPLFAGGLAGLPDAQALANEGVFRLCVDAARLGPGRLTEAVAEYARLLGRCV